jgi:hypothetical protein
VIAGSVARGAHVRGPSSGQTYRLDVEPGAEDGVGVEVVVIAAPLHAAVMMMIGKRLRDTE